MNYWKLIKNKLIAEGSQLVSATNQLKLVAADGKRYMTDVVDTEHGHGRNRWRRRPSLRALFRHGTAVARARTTLAAQPPTARQPRGGSEHYEHHHEILVTVQWAHPSPNSLPPWL